MTNRTTYPSYKPSGIDWLGDIPSHWRMQRLGALLAETKKLNTDLSVDQILSLTRDRGVIPYEDKGNVGNKASEDISRYKVVEIGDLVLNSMNVIIGSVGLSKLRGSLSPVYYVLRSRNDEELSMQYAAAIFSLPTYQDSLKRIGNGILAHRMRIPWEALKNENLPLPPLDEQRAIADYLDRKDAQITRFIESRRRMIALLEEKKQAIINQAVTRGLDPSVPMKDSGVEWLGEIPAHWEVRRLQSLAQMNRQSLPENTNREFEFDYIDIGSVGTGVLIDQPERIRFETAPSRARRLVQNGDTILSTVRTYLKAVYHFNKLEGPTVVSTGFATLSPKKRIKSRFLKWCVISDGFVSEIESQSTGVSYPAINETKVGKLSLPLPPLDDQYTIANHLDHFEKIVSQQELRLKREIKLMMEYRTRLISDVVTGKVRVPS